MPPRVSPIERLRAEIAQRLSREGDLPTALEEVARLGARLLLQTALEAEVSEFLGRERYQRGRRRRPGYRNGSAPLTVRTTAGPVMLARPKLRGTDEAFTSRLLGRGVTRTTALESLVIAAYVRGLSDRDVEAALREALGPEAAISRSTVSRVCQTLQEEFQAWQRRDLSGVELLYLFLDGSHFRMHHASARAEPVLCARGITTDGAPVFLSLEAASSESREACLEFLRGLTGRGLRAPLLVTTDGAPGLIAAVAQVFPQSLRQRCLVHKARNVLARVSRADQARVKADYWAIFDDIEAAEGRAAQAEARRRAEAFAEAWERRYPGAVRSVRDDLDALIAHLRCPREHWRRIRHTNLLERTFGESRRRVKVIGRLPGERSCLSLVWAVLDRTSRGWRGVTLTPSGIRLLQELRRELFDPPPREAVGRRVARTTQAA
jgi:transposase-like protein